ncbi:hypothetical protein SAV31267_001130 [Streptomyces avermitilis]|uniref:Uncharacterized protein n=1 Tax=Streptomyces avermitilis TaxID=33903 RepID=A0A4D4MF71_STRAX|nr:hypothetical protein SAV31267_001130 [Streptomyces avermitilis]
MRAGVAALRDARDTAKCPSRGRRWTPGAEHPAGTLCRWGRRPRPADRCGRADRGYGRVLLSGVAAGADGARDAEAGVADGARVGTAALVGVVVALWVLLPAEGLGLTGSGDAGGAGAVGELLAGGGARGTVGEGARRAWPGAAAAR